MRIPCLPATWVAALAPAMTAATPEPQASFVEVAKLTPPQQAINAEFGHDVDISGNVIVVGAPNANALSGATYVFERLQASWVLTQTLLPPAGSARFFGTSVSIDGDRIAVGAVQGTPRSSVFLYEREGGSWELVERILDPTNRGYFGYSVALDGDRLAVRARSDGGLFGQYYGSAFVYERQFGGWTQQIQLESGLCGDGYGYRVALGRDLLAVSAFSDSLGFCYKFPVNEPSRVYVHARDSGGLNAWGAVALLEMPQGLGYAKDVALAGNTLATVDHSNVHIHGRNVGGTNAFGRRTYRPVPHTGAIDMDLDGLLVVGRGVNEGWVAVYYRNQGGPERWGQVDILEPQGVMFSDGFGFSVGVSGNTVVGGAPFDDDMGSNAGAAWVFTDSGHGNLPTLVPSGSARSAR